MVSCIIFLSQEHVQGLSCQLYSLTYLKEVEYVRIVSSILILEVGAYNSGILYMRPDQMCNIRGKLSAAYILALSSREVE
jgi:hypothetical protein